jgi:hypothetical protein
MLQSELAYRCYCELYNKFMDTRFDTTEEALVASRAVSDQLVVYKDAMDAEYQAAETAYAMTAEGIQEAADIAAYKAYNAQFEVTDA